MGSESTNSPWGRTAEWAINSEAMRARRIIVLVKSNELVFPVATIGNQAFSYDWCQLVKSN